MTDDAFKRIKKRRAPKFLIVDADDFGLHPAVNAGIVQAHARGIVTSASLIANGSAFGEAVRIAKRTPTLDIGVHLTLVEERPVLPRMRVSTLVNSRGFFWQNYGMFFLRFLLGGIDKAQIEAEWEAQVKKILAAGIVPTHLNSHQHLHLFPQFFPIALRLAKKYSIPFIRLAQERPSFYKPFSGRPYGLMVLSVWSRRYRKLLQQNGVKSTGQYFGFAWSGHLTSARFHKIISRLHTGTTELLCHPAIASWDLRRVYPYGFEWEDELHLLCSPDVQKLLVGAGVTLWNFARAAKMTGRSPRAVHTTSRSARPTVPASKMAV